MPQMRIKASVENWNDLKDTADRHENIQGFINTFFNTANMYLYGNFNEDNEYSYLSGNWQSNFVIATLCDGMTKTVSLKDENTLIHALNIPYGNLPTDSTIITTVGKYESIGVFPNINTTLIQNSTCMYLLGFKVNADNSIRAYREALPLVGYHCPPEGEEQGEKISDDTGADIILETYIGKTKNEDNNIKPSDIVYDKDDNNYEKRLKVVSLLSSLSDEDILYQLETEKFDLHTTGSGATAIQAFYKIGIVCFEINESNHEVTYNKYDSVLDELVHRTDIEGYDEPVPDYTLLIGDEDIKIQDIALDNSSKAFTFCFKKRDVESNFYKLCNRTPLKENASPSYYRVPTNVIFPLYYDTDTYIKGIAYMRLYRYNGESQQETPLVFSDTDEFSYFENRETKFKSLELHRITDVEHDTATVESE